MEVVMARYLWAGILTFGLLVTACASNPGLLPQTKGYLDGVKDCTILVEFRERSIGTATVAKLSDDSNRARASQAAYDYAGRRMKELDCP